MNRSAAITAIILLLLFLTLAAAGIVSWIWFWGIALAEYIILKQTAKSKN